MEISLSSNSITDVHIATKFGTSHDSPAVVPCAKYCSDHCISIWMGAKWNFHHIWIVMEKLLVKWAPDHEPIATMVYGAILHHYAPVGKLSAVHPNNANDTQTCTDEWALTFLREWLKYSLLKCTSPEGRMSIDIHCSLWQKIHQWIS